MNLLANDHISPETAYLVEDYPYGFTLRCSIRYWIEYKPKLGFRLMSQTSNPKKAGLVWNKPKGSTYSKFGGALYFDDQGHVKFTGLSEYCDGAEAKAWADTYGAAVPSAGRDMLTRFVASKLAYDAARAPFKANGEIPPLNVGLAEARKAFAEAIPPRTIEEKRAALWRKTHADFKGLSSVEFSPHWPDKSRTIMLPMGFHPGQGSTLARLDDLTEEDLDKLLK